MNSKQRRKDRKRWQYHVLYEYPESTSNADDIEIYLAMFNWCRDQWGDNVERCGWRDRGFGDRWEFDCSKKATLFALRWG